MAAQSGKYREHGLVVYWATAGVLLLAILFRLALLAKGVYPFNSDEAIVALMARHTLAGDWPIFFYGQAYMGSLDAALVALGFSAFGQHVWVIRLVQSLLFVGVVYTSIQLAQRLTYRRQASLVTGLLLAIPTVNLNLYTTVSLGGYGEALLVGNLLLLLGLRLAEGRIAPWLLVLWGVLAGMGFWAFGLTLIYTVPALIMMIAAAFKRSGSRKIIYVSACVLVGFILGVLPILLWMVENGVGRLLAELLGAAVAGTSGSGYWPSVLRHLLSFGIFGVTATLGFRAPWRTDIFFWPLGVVVGLFWIAVVMQYIRILRNREGDPRTAKLLGGVAFCLLLGFVFTPFGGDPSGRYFLPLNIVAAVLASSLFVPDADWIPRWFKWAMLTCVVAYHLFANLQVAFSSETGFTTQFDRAARIDHASDQELLRFLREHDELRGYTNYWVAYPLAFKSNEEIIFVPRLPYHRDFRYTPRDNRYEPYNSIVAESGRIAYITTNHPELNEKIRLRFRSLAVEWDEKVIGDFHVFYNLSRAVAPEEIDATFTR